MLKIAITGHRKLLNVKEVHDNIYRSLQYFQTLDKDLLAISALAVGVDTIFALEAIRLNILIRYILPFELKNYEQDFSIAEREVLHHLLAHNNHQYEVINPLKDTSSETRKEAYLEVGKRLVDESDILLAVWDGQPSAGKGGTAEIVEYAKSKAKELHIVNGIHVRNATTP